MLYEAAARIDARLTSVRSEQRNLRGTTCTFSSDAALEEGRVQEMGEARSMRIATHMQVQNTSRCTQNQSGRDLRE